MRHNTRRNRDWTGEQNQPTVPATPTGRYLDEPVSYFRPLSNFFDDMERMFERSFRTLPAFSGAPALWHLQMFSPSLDITSGEAEYTITAEMPGLEEKDIRLEISREGLLTISGEKRQERMDSRKDTLRSECNYGSFERSLTLPEDVDPEGIEARFRNGVLTITCPRDESVRHQARDIPINARGRGEESRRGNEESRIERGPMGPKKAA